MLSCLCHKISQISAPEFSCALSRSTLRRRKSFDFYCSCYCCCGCRQAGPAKPECRLQIPGVGDMPREKIKYGAPVAGVACAEEQAPGGVSERVRLLTVLELLVRRTVR